MKTKTLYRSLMVDTGTIELKDYNFYDGQIVLEEIQVPYDDVLKEEHRKQLIDAIERNIQEKTAKHNAEMFKLSKMRDELLQIEYKHPLEGELMPRGDFDDDIPF